MSPALPAILAIGIGISTIGWVTAAVDAGLSEFESVPGYPSVPPGDPNPPEPPHVPDPPNQPRPPESPDPPNQPRPDDPNDHERISLLRH